MARLDDLHETEAAHIRQRTALMPRLELGPLAEAPPLVECTVAVVSTAGLHRRDDRPFSPGENSYRLIGADVESRDLILSHISANFDRSAFQHDPNIVFPIDRLRELAEEGEIGGLSRWHYSFMGAMPDPTRFAEAGTDVGRMLAADGVDVAILIPV